MLSKNLLVILLLFYFFCGYSSLINLIKDNSFIISIIIVFICMYLTKSKKEKYLIWFGVIISLCYHYFIINTSV